MNIPTSVEAIAVIAILFIPGYIFLQFTKNAVAFIPQNVDARYFFAVITWGGLLHLGFFWWTRIVLEWYLSDDLDDHQWEVARWAAIVLVIAPLVAGLLGSWIIKLRKNTAGVWVKQDEISHVMFYTRPQPEVTRNGQDDTDSTEPAPEAASGLGAQRDST